MWASFNARALGHQLTAGESIRLAAEAGFEGVDLLVRDAIQAGIDPRELRHRIEDAGLRAGAWPLPVAWRGDEGLFRDDLRSLPRLAAAAAVIGLRRTGTWVMPEVPAGKSPAGIAELHQARLEAVARILQDHGIRLGLEAIGVESFRTGSGPRLATRLDELDALVGPLRDRCANVGLLVDAFHLYAAGEPLSSALIWGVDRVVWVHVADLPEGASLDRRAIRDDQRGLPGDSGAIDVRGLLRLLAGAGYHGPVTVETLRRPSRSSGDDPATAASMSRAALAAVWPLNRTASGA